MRKLVEDSNYDVIAISESWLNSTVINAEVELIGYKLSRLDRQKKQKRGRRRLCVMCIPAVHWKQRCWRIWLAFRVQASISCGCRFNITNWDPFSCVLPIDHLTVTSVTSVVHTSVDSWKGNLCQWVTWTATCWRSYQKQLPLSADNTSQSGSFLREI